MYQGGVSNAPATLYDEMYKRLGRLPIRVDLFLIGHNDDTGRCHTSRRALSAGLAGAALLEPWLTGQIQIGWRYDGGWIRDPGQITVLHRTPSGDRFTDEVIAHTLDRHPVKEFLGRLSRSDIYDQVQQEMTSAGVLQRTIRRRFGVASYKTHVPVTCAHSVRARGKIREAASYATAGVPAARHTGDPDADAVIALSGLVMAVSVSLTKHVHTGAPRALARVIEQLEDPTIRDVCAALH